MASQEPRADGAGAGPAGRQDVRAHRDAAAMTREEPTAPIERLGGKVRGRSAGRRLRGRRAMSRSKLDKADAGVPTLEEAEFRRLIMS